MATTNKNVLEYDAATGETVEREMSAEEIAAMPQTTSEIEINPDGVPA